MTFSGGMRVDGTLDLPGTGALAVDHRHSHRRQGEARERHSGEPEPGGTGMEPERDRLDLKAAVSQIVKEGGSALLGRAFGVDPETRSRRRSRRRSRSRPTRRNGRRRKRMRRKRKLEDEAKNRLKGLFGSSCRFRSRDASAHDTRMASGRASNLPGMEHSAWESNDGCVLSHAGRSLHA